ncbi:MAG: CDGSH iron-sulfur domain-containing protein [Betaproteobacteria bacterium]|jgi:CDGSH-type Zn-finger protein|nr:MAG: CDGSH iron-sulfur domain-containing protein [Betaproteobacteria bacterium]
MTNTIRPQVDGPLMVEGDAEVFAADGISIKKDANMWLCRCGLSSKKPFCDGTHNKAGFSDAATVSTDYVIKKLEAGMPAANLRLTLRQDGPIHCFGDTSIVGQDGSAWNGNQANLCRCGQSKNKPFCDGSHIAAEFKS